MFIFPSNTNQNPKSALIIPFVIFGLAIVLMALPSSSNGLSPVMEPQEMVEQEDTTTYLTALVLVRLPAHTPMAGWKDEAELLEFVSFPPDGGEYLIVTQCPSEGDKEALCTTRRNW